MAKIVYPELSYQVMGAVFTVHKGLGPGFLESVYENALMAELQNQGLKFEHQKPVDIVYGNKKVGQHKLDLVIEDKLVLELKTAEYLSIHHKAQLLSYLKATGYLLGILVNFSKAKVEYKRIINTNRTN